MGAWFDFPQIWTNTISSSAEYINYSDPFTYSGPYYSYNTNYTLTAEDIQDFANSLSSIAVSTSEAESWFNSIEITTPIKRRGAKMG